MVIIKTHLPFLFNCRRMVPKWVWEVPRWQAQTPASTYCRFPPSRWLSSCSSTTEKSALSRWGGHSEAPLSGSHLCRSTGQSFKQSLFTTFSLVLSSSVGDPAGDWYPRVGVIAGVAVPGLWETHTEGSHQGAKVQGDWKRTRVYSQWSVYFQTAQSQNTDRYTDVYYRELKSPLLSTTVCGTMCFWFEGFISGHFFLSFLLCRKIWSSCHFNKYEHVIII